jgi:hypothetical protein
VPGINGEPYYDGMENAEPGGDLAALYCRSAAYGSMLSGGLGGHIYGAGGWQGGLWSGEVESASEYPVWNTIQWPSADQMRHLKTFMLSEGSRYQELEPEANLLTPNKSGGVKTYLGWAYCARTSNKDLFLCYFEKNCPPATLSGVAPKAQYRVRWFNPRSGVWLDSESGVLNADSTGKISLPGFPESKINSENDWALKLNL